MTQATVPTGTTTETVMGYRFEDRLKQSTKWNGLTTTIPISILVTALVMGWFAWHTLQSPLSSFAGWDFATYLVTGIFALVVAPTVFGITWSLANSRTEKTIKRLQATYPQEAAAYGRGLA